MKIVQINTVYGTGSTGKIAAALSDMAYGCGFEAYAAYGRGKPAEDDRRYRTGTRLNTTGHMAAHFILGKNGFSSAVATKRLLAWLDSIQPDLLHLHNLHGFYIHAGLLFEYIKARDIPVVWTLHDCWSFTGQCAYFESAGCEKWKSGCHDCPVSRWDYPCYIFRNSCEKNYLLKKDAFTGVKNMVLVTPSQWLAEKVRFSLLKDYPVKVIPNGIDLHTFRPVRREADGDKRDIILGVANRWDRRKGMDSLLQLSKLLDSRFTVVLIGVSAGRQWYIHLKYGDRVQTIGKIADQKELASWYSRARVYVNPTLDDCFPTTNLEALACGTPVITFCTGGSPESITDTCGRVISGSGPEALRQAVLSVCDDPRITPDTCRQRAMAYDRQERFGEYMELYRQLLS